MFTAVRKYLSPPVFTDTDVNFTARNLNVILLSAFAGIMLTIIRYMALGKIWRGNTGLILITGAFVIVLGYFLLRRRQILVGSLVTVTVLTLLPFLMMIEGDGIHDTAIMLLPVMVIAASMLFPGRGLIAYVAVVVLAFGVLVRIGVNGFPIAPSGHPVTNSDFTDALTILTAAALMAGLTATALRRNLGRLYEALKEREVSEERYRLISGLTTDYVFSSTVRKDGHITNDWESGAFKSISGYTSEEFRAHGDWRTIVHPEDLHIDDQILDKLKQNQQASGDMRIITKSGEIKWVRVYARPIWDEKENCLVGIYGADQDITERKRAEESMRKSEELYRKAIVAAGAVPYYRDFRTNSYTFMGEGILPMTGYSAAEIVPEIFDSIATEHLLRGSLAQLSYEEADRFTEEGVVRQWECDYRIRTRDGQTRWVADTAVQVRDENDKRIGVIGILQDVTERKLAEEKLRQRADQMAALNDLGLTIASTLDLDQIFHDLFEKCSILLAIDTFYIALYDEATHQMTMPLYFDSGEYKKLPPRDIRENPGLSGYVVTTRQTLYVPDITSSEAKEKYRVVFTGGIPSHAYVGVPMFYQGRVIGLISMQNHRPDAYSQEDIRFFETIAAQASIAIENARLFQEAKQRANEMALLYQIGLALAGGENLYDALRALVQELRRWMIVDTFYVGLYEEQTSTISFPLYLANDDDQRVLPRNLKEKPGLTKEVIDRRKTLYLPDLSDPIEQARHDIVWIVTLDIHAFVSIPLLLENKIIGVMSVQSIQPNAYTPDNIRLLETLAAQVAITLEKARLFESERQALAQSETLRESAAIITATLDESEASRRILEQLQRVVPYDKASVQLIRGDYLEVVGGQGLSQDCENIRFQINEREPSLPILKGHVPYILYKNIQEEVSWFNEISEDDDIHTWLAVPLKVKGIIFGLIALDGFKVGQFNERHAQLAVAYADQVAIALENARLYESARQELTERKKAQLELEASNRELESLSYNIAHDMRSPVRALVGLSQMLQHSQGERMDEDGRSELERIHLAAKRLGSLIDGFLEFLRLGRSPLRKQLLAPESLLRGLVNRFGAAHPERDIQFIVGDFPACEADIALLEQAWSHLIANAVKFTRSRLQARIELGSGEKDGELYYFIRDNGIGFDMKYADKIFVIFQHLNRQEDYEGVGVGLAIVQRIIHRHGGRIWAEAASDQGATFYFTLT